MPPTAASAPRSPVVAAGCAIEPVLVSFPFVCFTLALVTDIVYWRTAYLEWQNFSAWLLFFGLVVGAVAAIFRIIGFIIRPDYRARPLFWPYAIGNVLAMLLALINSFVHAQDGWPAVVPNGLILSALTVLVMIVTWFLGMPRVSNVRGGRA